MNRLPRRSCSHMDPDQQSNDTINHRSKTTPAREEEMMQLGSSEEKVRVKRKKKSQLIGDVTVEDGHMASFKGGSERRLPGRAHFSGGQVTFDAAVELQFNVMQPSVTNTK